MLGDKPSSITWEEKHQRDGPSSEVVNIDTSFLIGLFLDVLIGQELNNAGLVVFTCVNDASSIVFGFATVGDGMSDTTDYPNKYWNSNEYDDDDDVGYMRQPIEDETWFLAHEIYYPSDNDIMEKLCLQSLFRGPPDHSTCYSDDSDSEGLKRLKKVQPERSGHSSPPDSGSTSVSIKYKQMGNEEAMSIYGSYKLGKRARERPPLETCSKRLKVKGLSVTDSQV
ncbi:hypothetical protein Tco_0488586 [Tanacetum coccineum]